MEKDADPATRSVGEATGPQREDYFSRVDTTVSSRFSQARRTPISPTSPRTPGFGRSISSNFNSPGPGFRTDDEYFVFDLGARYLRAGLSGEDQPRCQLAFGPQTQRRAGDYSPWLQSGSSSPSSTAPKYESWGSDYVLWQMDLRGVDMGFVEDKLERVLRRAIVEYLLVLDDSKKRKFILAVPSIMPQPLLSTLLSALFNVFVPPPSIVLLSSPVLNTVAAGLRSSLIVDIGWAATNVTSVYEYREVNHRISQRGMKLLSWNVRSLLQAKMETQAPDVPATEHVSFEDVEEVLHRMTWCRKRQHSEDQFDGSAKESNVYIPLRSVALPNKLSIPFSELANPVDSTFFPLDMEDQELFDDEELPLPLLLFNTLLSLPVDVRRVCSSRIVITGGGSNIPGLKPRLLDEVSRLLLKRGWDPVENYGSAKAPNTKRIAIRPNGAAPVHEKTYFGENVNGHTNKDMDPDTNSATHLQPPLPDPPLATRHTKRPNKQTSEDSSRRLDENDVKPPSEHNHDTDSPERIQGARSLGAWAGASLIAGLRIRGEVEIEREKFLQHGLHAPAQPAVPKRQSMLQAAHRQSLLGGVTGTAAGQPGGRDSGTWTLGVWA